MPFTAIDDELPGTLTMPKASGFTPLEEEPITAPRGFSAIPESPQLSADSFKDYLPLQASGGKQIGSYKLSPGEAGTANVHVNVVNPKTAESQSDVLQVPIVTDELLNAERAKAQADFETSKLREGDLRNAPDPELGAIAAQSESAYVRDASLRMKQLEGEEGRKFLQNEHVQNAFRATPAGQKFEEWHPGEDFLRGAAGLETGLNYAYQSTFGDSEAEKKAREAVSAVPEAFPGTTNSSTVGKLARGVAELGGQLPLITNPVGAAALGVSTYGQTVADSMNAADAADAQSQTFEKSNPEMAEQFKDLADSMRSDAKLHGVLSGTTMAFAGRLLPEAKTYLGGVARSSAEWAGINTIEDQLNQQFKGTKPNPGATVEGLIGGALMGAGHGLLPSKAPEVRENLAKVEQADQQFTAKTQAAAEIINAGAQNPNTSLTAQAAAEKLSQTIPQAHEEQKGELAEALKPLAEAEKEPAPPSGDITQNRGSAPVESANDGGAGDTQRLSEPPVSIRESEDTESAPLPQDQIVAATFTDENGTVHEGQNHVEAADKAGVQAPNSRPMRETPEYGFMVESPDGASRVVSRREALEIAKKNGQLDPDTKVLRGRLHSDQIEMAPRTPQEAPPPESGASEPPEPPSPPESTEQGQKQPSGDFPNPMAAKNANVDAAARAAGLPETLKAEPISFKEEFAKQGAKMKADQLAGQKLVDQLDNQGRANVTPQEQALLAHEFIRVTNGLKENDAILDNPDATPEEKADAQVQNAYWEDRFAKTQEISNKAGTNSSLALLARKIGLRDDHSYEGVVKRLSKSLGHPLDRTERAMAQKMSDDLQAAEKAHAAAVERADSPDVERAAEVVDELKKRTATGTGKKIAKEDVLKALKEFKGGKSGKEISFSRPEAALDGLPEVTEDHQNAAVNKLKQTEIGRKVLRDSIIVPDWQRAIAHPEFSQFKRGQGFTGEEVNNIKRAEGFFDPISGKSVVIRENVRPRTGETPELAVRRVLLHERVGHEGVEALRKLDPKFDADYRKIVSQIPEAELSALRGRYGDTDPDLLVKEWIADQFGKIDPDGVPDPKTAFGKFWQAIKDFAARYFGPSSKLDQQVRDLMGQVLRSPEALESRRGFGDVMASLPEEEGKDFSKLPHSILELIAKYHVQEGVKDVHDLTSKMKQTLDEGGFGGVTESGIHKALSKYGETILPSKEEAAVQLRDLKGQMRLLSQLKDAKEGVMPALTGMLRDKPSPEARELEKQVRDEIRNQQLHRGTKDQERASALDAKKSRLENAIEDTEKQLKALKAGRSIQERPRQKVENDEHADLLEKELKRMRIERDQILEERKQPAPQPGDYFADISRKVEDSEKRIKELEGKIASGDLSAEEPKESPTHPLLEEKRTEIKALNKKLADMRKDAAAPERERLQLEKQIKDANDAAKEIEDKIASGDLSVEPKKPSKPVHPDLQAARDNLAKANKELAEKRAARDKPARDAEKAQNDLDDAQSKAIQLEAKLDSGDLSKNPAKHKEVSAELQSVRDQIKGLNKGIAKARLDAEKPAREAKAAAKELADAKERVAELEKKLSTGDLAPKESSVRTVPAELQAERDKLSALNKQMAKARKEQSQYTPPTAEEQAAAEDAVLKRLKARSDELDRRVKENDFSKTAKKSPASNKEIESTKIALARKKTDYENLIYKNQQSLRSKSQKFWDGVVRAKRAFLLTSATVFGKLAAAVQARAFTTTLEELVNHGISAVAPKELVNAAKLEGRGDVSGYAKAYAKAFMKWMDDVKDIYATGKTDLDVLHGKYRGNRDDGWDSILGKLHYMVKAPAKRAAFEHASGKLTESAIRDGENPLDDDVKARIAMGAYKAGERAIFMQDNALVNAFRAGIGTLEKGGWNGTARTLRVLFPIVKVPTNLAGEALQYAGGVPVGLVKLAKVWSKGFETLKPEEADLIMRQLKKGSIGGALLALGFLASGSVGGYYQEHTKRKAGDPKPGGVKIGGIDIPSWLMHSPAFQALQMGATLRHVAESHTKDGGTVGYPWGAAAAVWGAVTETPFVNESTRLGNLNSQQGREQYLGDLVRAQVEPQLLQQAAKATDSGPARKPTGILENLEMGVPGLRENVPIKVSDAFPPSDNGKIPPAIERYAQKGGAMPGAPQQAELKKHNPRLSQQTWERFVEARGKLVKSMLLEDVDQLGRLDKDGQHAAVSAISKDATDGAKRQLNLQ